MSLAAHCRLALGVYRHEGKQDLKTYQLSQTSSWTYMHNANPSLMQSRANARHQTGR